MSQPLQIWRQNFKDVYGYYVEESYTSYEGFFGNKKVVRTRRKWVAYPLMDIVRQFVHRIGGYKKVVNISEYCLPQYRDNLMCITIFYKAEKPIKFRYKPPKNND